MARFINGLTSSARIEALLAQAIPAVLRNLAAGGFFDSAANWAEMSVLSGTGYLRARLRRPIHDYLDQLERTESGLVFGRRQQLFAEIRERLVEHLRREKRLPASGPSVPAAGSRCAELPVTLPPRKAA